MSSIWGHRGSVSTQVNKGLNATGERDWVEHNELNSIETLNPPVGLQSQITVIYLGGLGRARSCRRLPGLEICV
jgi:hypothetical protein